MNETLKKIHEMCEYRNCDLVIKHYGYRQVCIMGHNEKEDEVFNVAVWYPPNQPRNFYIEVNSKNEEWRGGCFTKEEILLLLSIDDLSDTELCIEPQLEREEKK